MTGETGEKAVAEREGVFLGEGWLAVSTVAKGPNKLCWKIAHWIFQSRSLMILVRTVSKTGLGAGA